MFADLLLLWESYGGVCTISIVVYPNEGQYFMGFISWKIWNEWIVYEKCTNFFRSTFSTVYPLTRLLGAHSPYSSQCSLYYCSVFSVHGIWIWCFFFPFIFYPFSPFFRNSDCSFFFILCFTTFYLVQWRLKSRRAKAKQKTHDNNTYSSRCTNFTLLEISKWEIQCWIKKKWSRITTSEPERGGKRGAMIFLCVFVCASFHIQLATVNKFTYFVIWYFNIILSPPFFAFIFFSSKFFIIWWLGGGSSVVVFFCLFFSQMFSLHCWMKQSPGNTVRDFGSWYRKWEKYGKWRKWQENSKM